MNKGYWWFAKLDKTWSIDNPYFYKPKSSNKLNNCITFYFIYLD